MDISWSDNKSLFEAYNLCEDAKDEVGRGIMINDIILIILLHFVADFLCQMRWMALGKCTSNTVLFQHIAAYSSVFFVASFLTPAFGLMFVLVNAIGHAITDWCSSRIGKWFHEQNQMYWFFATLGLDQTIHMLTLILSYEWLQGR